MNHKVPEDHEANHEVHKGHEANDEAHEHQKARRDEYSPLSADTELLIHEVIGAALAVHRQLGPGFLETVYERAMRVELASRHLPFETQRRVEIKYRGVTLCRQYLDLVVGGVVVVEVKAVRKLRPIHEAQVISYLKATGMRAGLLLNFNVSLLIDGLRRFIR